MVAGTSKAVDVCWLYWHSIPWRSLWLPDASPSEQSLAWEPVGWWSLNGFSWSWGAAPSLGCKGDFTELPRGAELHQCKGRTVAGMYLNLQKELLQQPTSLWLHRASSVDLILGGVRRKYSWEEWTKNSTPPLFCYNSLPQLISLFSLCKILPPVIIAWRLLTVIKHNANLHLVLIHCSCHDLQFISAVLWNCWHSVQQMLLYF